MLKLIGTAAGFTNSTFLNEIFVPNEPRIFENVDKYGTFTPKFNFAAKSYEDALFAISTLLMYSVFIASTRETTVLFIKKLSYSLLGNIEIFSGTSFLSKSILTLLSPTVVE